MIKKLRAGIFGGSFNPPHLAHQLIAQKALDELNMDVLIILPTYQNPLKNISPLPNELRLNWCKKIFDDKRMLISSYEIDNKINYTYKSIGYFNELYEVKYLIIGSDNIKDLEKWRNFEWINDTITWIVFTRDNNTVDTSLLKKYKIIKFDLPISSTQIRQSGDLKHIDDKIKKSVKNTLEGK